MEESSFGGEQRHETDGLLAVLPDLSANTVEQFQVLARSPWVAVVKIPMSRQVLDEATMCATVESHLLGRDPAAIYTVEGDALWIDFTVESGNDETRQAVAVFVTALAGLVGAGGTDPEQLYSVGYINKPSNPPVDYERIKHL